MQAHAHPQPLVFVPHSEARVLHLIRHGEGFHNVAGEVNEEFYKLEQYRDAHLTERGWKQAALLGQHIRSANMPVELVVTSPLTRTLETACGVFGRPALQKNAPGPLLMTEQEGLEGIRVQRAALSGQGVPRIIANEMCRERRSMSHPCDQRRPVSHYTRTFPAVDFSLLEHEDDQGLPLADVTPEGREKVHHVRARARQLLQWLLQRPE
eukprot:CAMPEP_0202911318 /NCGR_PEP_ID=MMETSP1392-20130828/54635_1 /ASSEMBLY_ACC=CAM_ASM_000868 /TAXON_ID=225041 /ORGANISM="Chlamydomonas chlamydogama, Strain SAG 11-48b" /LENGTH=209 /DNA_ID=CAMNT_0049601783 /DNA_START=221 /DNA_END=847 /DNA_ORIENTATION=+